ncbi:mitochondrial peptide methionine sulfoxide reductase [Patagioenas fasciata monilis]|uniref:peptide-methionine (S)-S-oxide reductase n=1 Tax=Patagioenas fasciata monilis TaxID=372326 RepID=A0A1V4K304_PATFA|nr:mitochondrial peptide methionine sulfoxide reductase [Patagioenas fasciata monilis]
MERGMGCFWGAERKFWRQNGVYSTQVGYAGGYTPNPTYKEVCSGKTGHAEVVRVVYQPENISFEKLLKVFWENHDPTQELGTNGQDYGILHLPEQYEEWISAEIIWAAATSSVIYRVCSLGFGHVGLCLWHRYHRSVSKGLQCFGLTEAQMLNTTDEA